MARWILVLALLVMVVGTCPVNAAEFLGSGASAQLPVKVRILDYKTTRRLCGSDAPPHWCPGHLLKTADSRKDVFATQELTFDTAETAKRTRIPTINALVFE